MRIGALALLVSTLAACGTATVVRPGGGNAGGVTTPKTSVPKPGQTVVVRKGDTIYALARIHDITPVDLIAWNRLDNPSTIYPGQVIRLYPQGPPAPCADHGGHPAAFGWQQWRQHRAGPGAGRAGEEQHRLALASRWRDRLPLRGR